MISRDPGDDRTGVVVEAEADEQSEPDHDRQRDEAAADVGESAPGEHGGTRHRQAAEAVDDAAVEILRKTDRGRHATDQHGLEEHGRHDIIDIMATGYVDRAAEHVAEEHEQHRGLQRTDQQHLRGARIRSRLRFATPPMSRSASAGVIAHRVVGRIGCESLMSLLTVGDGLTVAGGARGSAGEREEHVVQRRVPDPEVVERDPRLLEP